MTHSEVWRAKSCRPQRRRLVLYGVCSERCSESGNLRYQALVTAGLGTHACVLCVRAFYSFYFKWSSSGILRYGRDIKVKW